jgi:hypothetical protein
MEGVWPRTRLGTRRAQGSASANLSYNMRRRDFLDCIAAPLASRVRKSNPQWLFRTFPGRIHTTDPLRQAWQRLCPNNHLWFEAVAAQSMPRTAILAWFPSSDGSVKNPRGPLPDGRGSVSPLAAELFDGPAGGLEGCNILEFRESAHGIAGAQQRVLRNSQCLLIGFHDLAERWKMPDREVGRIAVFRAERG